jgi:DNA-binding NtrC family response regulator
MARVLVVEADTRLRSAISHFLRDSAFDVREAATYDEARRLLGEAFDAVVLEHRSRDGEAFDLLPALFARGPRPVVIVLTAHGSIDLALRLVNAGVQQFLTKPVELPTLLRELEQYLAQRAAAAKRSLPPRSLPPPPSRSGVSRAVSAPFFGPSPAAQELRSAISLLKSADRPVLFVGESGTGKTTLARYLHTASRRGAATLIELCGQATDEAELDGVLHDLADGSTIHVRELGELPREAQERLLELSESARVRLLATTRTPGSLPKPLEARFEHATLAIPALRDRPEDILPLARHFLDALCTTLGRPKVALTSEAEGVLVSHSWRGNVRELKNCIERALVLGDGGLVNAADVQLDGATSLPPPLGTDGATRSLEGVEIEHIRRVLGEVSGRVDAAAVLLQVPRSTLYERIRRYGIDLGELRRRRS